MTGSPRDVPGRGGGMMLRPEEISPAEAKAALEQGRAMLVDVRTPEEWDLVHLPGAVLVPLGELERRHDEIEPGPGQEVLVICHHGVRSLRAALALRALGRPELAGAKSVAGGMELWSLQADRSVPRYERGPGVLRLLGH